MGSGMIIDKEGRILTNYHVVREVDEIRVKLADNRSFEAEVIGKDPPSDIAVIQIKGDVPADLPTVELGNSDALEVGSVVMAIGAPFGYVQTVTTGVISAKGRSGVGVNTYEDFLQTDAAINPGNSGGPLINMRGEVVGINAVIATRIGQFAGVGFAIPINMVKTLLPTLSKGETVTRGLLGVIIQEVTLDLAKQFGLEKTEGALVSQVNPDSPADKAGIKAGDVIVRFRDRPVEDTSHLRNMVAATTPGTEVNIEIVRNGEPRSLNASIGKLTPEDVSQTEPSSDTGKNQLKNLGMEVQTLDSKLAAQLGYEGQKGVVVTQVQPGSPASVAGLSRGDLIVEVNREPVTTADELQQALEKAKNSALILIKRRDASRFVVIQLE
jgi:serine protease Do